MTPLLAPRLGRSPEASFERLYRKHVRDVYGFAYGVFGNRPDAEDVTQSTFLNAYRAFMRGEDVENMRAWLLAIAQNVCRQRFRTSSRRPKEVELDQELADAFVDDDAPTAGEIRSAMEQLAFNQRVVVVLREIEGLSYEEIADTMDITLSAVETLLFRARRALREQLEAADRPLSCDAVERLISLQLDGKLARQDKGLLRAHLRTCPDCARVARSQRARKRVMPGLGGAPLPVALAEWWQPASVGIGAKVATAVGIAIVTGGALVTTGVVPTPASDSREAVRAIDERGPVPDFGFAPIAELAAVADRVSAGEAARDGSSRKDGPVKADKQGDGRLAKAKRTRSEGSTPPPPPPSPLIVAVPPQVASVGSAVAALGGTVTAAPSKIAPDPGSIDVEPPSLPSVTVPDVDDTVPLP